jgi:hypothetical protein
MASLAGGLVATAAMEGRVPGGSLAAKAAMPAYMVMVGLVERAAAPILPAERLVQVERAELVGLKKAMAAPVAQVG